MNDGFPPKASLRMNQFPCEHHKKGQIALWLTHPREKIECFGSHEMTKLYNKIKAEKISLALNVLLILIFILTDTLS